MRDLRGVKESARLCNLKSQGSSKGRFIGKRKMPEIHKYARNAEEWRKEAEATYDAAELLFGQQPSFWFSASLLGHHTLEMLPKSALFQAGCTIARPPRPSPSRTQHGALAEA